MRTSVINLNTDKLAMEFAAGKGRYVYVGRGTLFGNPYRDGTRERNVTEFYKYLRGKPELVAAVRTKLKGKVLGCWCVPSLCHASVLACVAEGMELDAPPSGKALLTYCGMVPPTHRREATVRFERQWDDSVYDGALVVRR